MHGVVERYYTCPRCGAKGEVAFTAIGRGNGIDSASLFVRLFVSRRAWIRASLGGIDPVAEAEAEQRKDAERVLGMIRCEACGKRPVGALVWPAIRIACFGAFGLLLTSLRFYLSGIPWWLGGVVLSAIALVIEGRRFHRSNHAATIKLTAPPPEARVVRHARKLEPRVAIAPPAPPPPPGDTPSLLT